MGSRERSLRQEKIWSPAPRDPRFSRRTPDYLRARADHHRRVTTTTDATSWQLYIAHSKVRKTPLFHPKRKDYIDWMKRIVERVEKKSVESAREVALDSPAPVAPAERPQTAMCQQPQRAVIGSEAFGPGVGSPVPPLGPLS